MSTLTVLTGGLQGRIVMLCVLSFIAFSYAWWNEWSRERPSRCQKRIAQTLLVVGLVGSLSTTIWASIDAARDAQQLQNTQNLALRAAERSNVVTLTQDQRRRVTEAMQPYAHLRVRVTCFPGASELCKPLIDTLQSAQLNVQYTLNYYNPGSSLDATPASFPHKAIVIALPAAYGAGEALIGVLQAQGIDAGDPEPTVWTANAKAAYAQSTGAYPLQIIVIP